jgi:hypothetical protein
MHDTPDKLNPDWPTLLTRITLEVAALAADEKEWLRERLSVIAATQVELDTR